MSSRPYARQGASQLEIDTNDCQSFPNPSFDGAEVRLPQGRRNALTAPPFAIAPCATPFARTTAPRPTKMWSTTLRTAPPDTRWPCPVLVLWPEGRRAEKASLDIWRRWPADVSGRVIGGRHLQPEFSTAEVLAELRPLLAQTG